MKILITGSAGFIGSHLVSYLLKKEDVEIIGIDDLSTGSKKNVLRNQKLYGDRYRFIEGNILQNNLLENNIKEAEYIIHLAAQVSVVKSSLNPLETHNINASAFLEIIELAKKYKLKKVIYPSSCAVYGEMGNKATKESSYKNPCSIYASTKYLNDLYASNLSKLEIYPEIVGLRLFNVFGSWQACNTGYAAVIPIWISRLLNGLDPFIYGDGKSTRDFIHVEDVCNAFYKVLIKKEKELNIIYNIGYGNSINLLKLFEILKTILSTELKIIDSNVKPVFKEPRIGEIKHSMAEISLARKYLNFKPTITIKEGIKEILINQYKIKI